jgi:hypothetical protein
MITIHNKTFFSMNRETIHRKYLKILSLKNFKICHRKYLHARDMYNVITVRSNIRWEVVHQFFNPINFILFYFF